MDHPNVYTWQLPGTSDISTPRCSVCRAENTDEHKPSCNAALAVCCHCKRPVVRVNDRPTTDIVQCSNCGREQLVPTTFCRRAA